MKRFLFILSLFAALRLPAADLVVSNNARMVILGDSMLVDQTAPCVGYRFPDFLESYWQLNYPGKNIHSFNLGRSGGTMDDGLTNNLQKNGVGLWFYQSNLVQRIGILLSTDNGGLTSNQMYLAHSNAYQAPAFMSDGTATLVSHGGVSGTNPVQWIGLGYIPEGTDGSSVERDRNNAGTNAGWTLGIRGVDWWNAMAPSWTNDFNNNAGANVGWPKSGHPGPGGQLEMTFTFLRGITTDTNISTATLDWNSTAPVATNHCVISGITKTGNTLTFNRLDDRLPFAWDYTNDFSQLATNDCSGAFALNPADADLFKYSIQITNLPAGNYQFTEDGETIRSYTDVQLANGVNLFTNFIGPTGRQRQEVLGRIRDKEYVDRVTHIPGSAGDHTGMQAYLSNAGTPWAAGTRGDGIVAYLTPYASNVFYLDGLTAAAAVPTNHVDALIQSNSIALYVPFHR